MSDFSDPTTGTQPDAPAASSPSPGLISSASAPPASRVQSAWSESPAKAAGDHAGEQASAAATSTVSLSAMEARILGSMVEKSFQTPDVYPMTTNALATACNQKSNRDPVVSYSAVDIDAALLELRQRNLVRRVHSQGSRSTKHRQTLEEALSLTSQQLVLVSVLMLRGPQTLNELRIRTERHDVGFEDLEAVESCLQTLSTRGTPLVEELPRQSGQKENRWQHLLSDSSEIAAEPTPVPVNTAIAAPDHAPSSPSSSGSSSSSGTGVASSPSRAPVAASGENQLRARVEELETEVASLRRQLSSLAAKLGEPLD